MLEKMWEIFTKGVFLATDEYSAGVLAAMLTPTAVSPFYTHRVLKADDPAVARQLSSDSIVAETLEIGTKSTVIKSVLGSRVVIGNDVKIFNSVLMDDVVVEQGSVITNTVVSSGVVIGAQSKVTNSQLAMGSASEDSDQRRSQASLSLALIDLSDLFSDRLRRVRASGFSCDRLAAEDEDAD
jgi:hypothetical protein